MLKRTPFSPIPTSASTPSLYDTSYLMLRMRTLHPRPQVLHSQLLLLTNDVIPRLLLLLVLVDSMLLQVPSSLHRLHPEGVHILMESQHSIALADDYLPLRMPHAPLTMVRVLVSLVQVPPKYNIKFCFLPNRIHLSIVNIALVHTSPIQASLQHTSLLQTSLWYRHLSNTDISLLQTSLLFRHLFYSDMSLIQTSLLFRHLSYSDISLIQTSL